MEEGDGARTGGLAEGAERARALAVLPRTWSCTPRPAAGLPPSCKRLKTWLPFTLLTFYFTLRPDLCALPAAGGVMVGYCVIIADVLVGSAPAYTGMLPTLLGRHDNPW